MKAEIKKQRDELLERMRAIQVPGPRTLTSELYEDMFVCIHGQTAYYLTSDDFSRIHGGGFVISYPVFDRSQPVPQKVSAWGRTIKESEYHALREASEAAEQKVEGVAR